MDAEQQLAVFNGLMASRARTTEMAEALFIGR